MVTSESLSTLWMIFFVLLVSFQIVFSFWYSRDELVNIRDTSLLHSPPFFHNSGSFPEILVRGAVALYRSQSLLEMEMPPGEATAERITHPVYLPHKCSLPASQSSLERREEVERAFRSTKVGAKMSWCHSRLSW